MERQQLATHISGALNLEISDHKDRISRWINDLESIYGQLDLYRGIAEQDSTDYKIRTL